MSQWADARRQLSSEASAEPGQWRTARAEYQREMMDVVNDPMVLDVVFMTSAQIGKSEILNNITGYFIDYDPCPILFLQPTVEMAEAFSKDRIAPMLRDSPSLSEKVARATSRDSGNTVLHKQFQGGQLTLAGANSPASLASRPIRILLADEIDKYPISAGTEGDPISLAEKRTNNFWNRKRVKVSTPTVKGASRIEAAFSESDQRYFYVPCPHCQEMQSLKWANVKWPPNEPERASYFCPHCAAEWSDGQKTDAIAQGKWRGSQPFKGIAGFHISELYSPWSSLARIAIEFLAAKDNPSRLQTWVNTCLGEVWESSKDEVEPGILMQRGEPYPLNFVPSGGLLLTAGVDVQGDRLEIYYWAYGEGQESWVVARERLDGDPAREVVWSQLLDYLERPIDHELGAQVVPRTVCIDSGGMHTQEVYTFCRLNAMRRTPYGLQQILAIQGQRFSDKPIMGKPSLRDISKGGRLVKNGIKLWPVGSSQAKKVLYARINIELPGPGYVHTSSALTEDFYDQLTAERLVTKYVKGFARQEWLLPAGRRNEALDCAVYALAAAHQLGLPRFREGDWNKARVRLTTKAPPVAATTDLAALVPVDPKPLPVAPAAPPPPATTRVAAPRRVILRPPQRRPNFTNNW